MFILSEKYGKERSTIMPVAVILIVGIIGGVASALNSVFRLDDITALKWGIGIVAALIVTIIVLLMLGGELQYRKKEKEKKEKNKKK